MENLKNDNQTSELSQLLRAGSEVSIEHDLEHGFVSDLHSKIHSENIKRSSLGVIRESIMYRLERMLWQPYATGFATLTIAIALTSFGAYFVNVSDQQSTVLQSESATFIALAEADLDVDFSGLMPAFSSEPIEF